MDIRCSVILIFRIWCIAYVVKVTTSASITSPPGPTPTLSSSTMMTNNNKVYTGKIAVTMQTDPTALTFPPPAGQNIASRSSAICVTVSRWSMWIDRMHPMVNVDEHELMTREEIMRFCARGVISKVECQITTGQTMDQSPDFATCSKEDGLKCSFLENFPMGCQDYRVRYECQEQTCQTPTAHPQTTTGGSISLTAHPTTVPDSAPSVSPNTAVGGVPTASPSTGPSGAPTAHSAGTGSSVTPYSTNTRSYELPSETSLYSGDDGSPTISTTTCVVKTEWSTWYNRHTPSPDTDEIERMSGAEKYAFCGSGTLLAVECQTINNIPFFSTGDFGTVCNITHGLVCSSTENFPVGCNDYMIRYQCQYCGGGAPTASPGSGLYGTSPIANPSTGSGLLPAVNKCTKSHLSSWINRDKPVIGDGDFESFSQREKEDFCVGGVINRIECVTSEGIPSYSAGEIVKCDIEHGLVCSNADNFPVPCSDYKIRYYCDCDGCPTNASCTILSWPYITNTRSYELPREPSSYSGDDGPAFPSFTLYVIISTSLCVRWVSRRLH